MDIESKLNYEELTKIVQRLLAEQPRTFDFTPFTRKVAEYLVTPKSNAPYQTSSVFGPILSQKNESTIREILWDMIVLRYLNPGGKGHDSWPVLTITDRGKAFFDTIVG
jgi:hypothetical protein